jgi:hypothetical protein
MEESMKTKLAIAAVLAAVIVMPASGQERMRQGHERSYDASRDLPRGVQKRQKDSRRAARRQQPCAAYFWGGCLGWDPDPNVRTMIQSDARLFDD